MSLINHSLKYIQALSLDVALGGVIGAMFVASYAHVSVGYQTYVVLGATIWLIYTLDHLLDTKNAESAPITFRHRFHWTYYTSLWGIWSFSLIMVLLLLYKLPNSTIWHGVIICGLVLSYFISIKFINTSKIYHKEVVAALIYSLGMFVPAISLLTSRIGMDIWLLFVEFFAIALVNLLIFSVFERSIDKEDGFHSLVIAMDVKSVKSIAWGLILAVFVVAFIGTMLIQSKDFLVAQLLIAGMNGILALILYKSDFFVMRGRYRLLGDAVFLIPGVYLLYDYVL